VKLAGRVALVTGASRGLGLAIGHALARDGAKLALMARPSEELAQAVTAMQRSGATVMAAPADVTREAEVEVVIGNVAKALGGLDLLVLNAGTWQGSPLADTSEAQWDMLIDLNLKGAFLPLKHAIPHLVRRGGATVVGISSIGGLVGQPGSAAYAASKWGLRGLLESAALELKKQRVRVCLVHPHNINSAGRAIAADSTERLRNLETAEIADLVAFVCSAPAHVAIGNVTIWPLDAGVTGTMTKRTEGG
jgi:NAD(P)-dependent dehydrogenase (short-subunit alcohol dehydrogenase family)